MFFVSLGKRRNRRRCHYFSPHIFAIVLLFFFDSKFFFPPSRTVNTAVLERDVTSATNSRVTERTTR